MQSITKKPVCFIAMAFGRDDTDAYYEQLILPILKRNDVKPIIINRQQSNDDLNFQIIEQLKTADFCIADLTYARQSVYFEAGFAQREIPVIYTVRKDHLDKGQPDDLRVHFDLQMKPLIVWKNPSDLEFIEKLEKRLHESVLESWMRNQESLQKYEAEIQEFASKPLMNRLALLRRQAILAFGNIGFNSPWARCTNIEQVPYKPENILNGDINNISTSQFDGEKIRYVAIQSYFSITKTELIELKTIYSKNIISNFSKNTYKALRTHRGAPLILADIFVFCIEDIPTKYLEDVFSAFTPNKSGLVYNKVELTTLDKGTLIALTVTIIFNFYFHTNVKSLHQIKGILSDFTSKFHDEKSKIVA